MPCRMSVGQSRLDNREARPEVRLFQGIARHRVAWMQEAVRSGSLNGGERATIAEEISW